MTGSRLRHDFFDFHQKRLADGRVILSEGIETGNTTGFYDFVEFGNVDGHLGPIGILKITSLYLQELE